MDPQQDNQFHVPQQDTPQEPPVDNDQVAADIARAKLEAAYDHDSNSDQSIHQPQGNLIQPQNPLATPPPPVSEATPQPDSPQQVPQSSTPSFEEYAAQQFNSAHTTPNPQSYQSYEPTQFQPQQPQSPPTNQAQNPVQSPLVSQLYAQENQQLNNLPSHQTHVAPDHQLPPEDPHYELPVGKRKGGVPGRLRPMLATAALVLFISVFYNNQLILGSVQSYINPAAQVASPTILDPGFNDEVSDEPRIIIPKINVDVPVVYDITTYDDAEIQKGLERGVVHYGRTPVPGENGNNVIVGHSSNSFWNDGTYKFAFILLDRLNEGDTFALHYEGKRYIYEVFKKEVVAPTNVEIAFEDYGEPVTTLITCTPPGTNWNRLAVVARQISPDPDEAKETNAPRLQERPEGTIPGSPPSLFDNVRGWFN